MNENKTIIERGAVCRVAIHGQISGSVFKCDNISDIIPTTYFFLGGGGTIHLQGHLKTAKNHLSSEQ